MVQGIRLHRLLFLLGWLYVVLAEKELYPTDIDRDISKELAHRITDPFWRSIIETQILYCPLVYMCTLDFLRDAEIIQAEHTTCCQQCNCDSWSCYYDRDCCPTQLMPNASLFVHGLMPDLLATGSVSLPECMYLQAVHPFKAFYNSEFRYLVVNKCPQHWNNNTIRNQCEHEEYLSFETEIINPPVAERSKGLIKYYTVYKNQACAICNGGVLTDLVKWDMLIKCSRVPSDQSLEYLKTKVLVENTCNILFLPPSDMSFRRCDWGVITECNMTGNWTAFDPDVEQSCHAYTSVYKKIYRNVFCAICNGEQQLPMGCERETEMLVIDGLAISFSAIMDFTPEKDKTPRVIPTEECRQNEVFDTYLGTCLQLSCASPGQYDAAEDDCRPSFSRVSQVKYNMNVEYFVSLQNLLGMCVDCVLIFGEAIWNHVNNMITNLFSFVYNICDVRLFHETWSNNSTMYFLAEISLYIDGFHTYTETLDTILNLTSLPVRTMPQTYFEYTIKSSVIGSLAHSNVQTRQLNRYRALEQPIFPPIGCRYKVAFQANVSQSIICPRVLLPYSLSIVSRDNNTVSIQDSNITFTSDYVSVDNTSVYVCRDEYISAVAGMVADRTTTPVSEGYMHTITDTDRAEVIVSFVGLCTTGVCLLVTIVTYSIFKSLRTAPGLNNLSLAVVLLIANVFFGFSFRLASYQTACAALGVLTHFFWLSAIVWMNVCCIHMFLVFASEQMLSTGTKHRKVYLLYAGYSVIFPLIFIAANMIYSTVVQQDIGYGGSACFIVRPHMLLYTFALPIGLLIVANILLFSVVLFKLRNMKDMPNSTAQRNVFVIYAKLSTLTGCSWIFGFLYQFTNIRALSFIFIVLTTFQGLFLMLAFIFNKRVAKLYLSKFSRRSFDQSTTTTNMSLSTSKTSITKVKNGESVIEKQTSEIPSS